jgi:replicative DNA helicase
VTVRDLGETFQDYAKWASDPRPRIGLGLPFFDTRTHGGIARGEIAMVMAFSSVGKTTLGLNVIRNNFDVPTLFFSLEMSGRYVAARLAAMEVPTTTSQVEYDYRTGQHPEYIQPLVDKYRALVIEDKPSIKLSYAHDAYDLATEKLAEKNLGAARLVIWDYMSLISAAGLLGGAEKIEKLAVGLRDWTRERDVSSIVLHQVGKSDSKDSGADPLSLDSGKYGGYEPMDYVVGAFAPRLKRGIPSSEFERVKDDIRFQLLKNRAGPAHPTPVEHWLDHRTMRLGDKRTLQPTHYRPQETLT